jgi:hypothetical protein
MPSTLDRMLQARLWGRPTVAWVLDIAVAVIALALLLLGDRTVQLLAVLMLLWRLVSVALGVLVWRRTAEGRAKP